MLTVEPLIAAICEHFARMSGENCGDKGGRREDGGGEGCRGDEGGGKGHDGHVSGGMVGSERCVPPKAAPLLLLLLLPPLRFVDASRLSRRTQSAAQASKTL